MYKLFRIIIGYLAIAIGLLIVDVSIWTLLDFNEAIVVVVVVSSSSVVAVVANVVVLVSLSSSSTSSMASLPLQ